jgi:hypothetical protein
MDIVGTYLSPAVSVAGAITSALIASRLRAHERQSGLGLIRYELRRLEIKMSIAARCPTLRFEGFDNVLPRPRLAEVTLSTEGASMMSAEVREKVYEAIDERGEHVVEFMKRDDLRIQAGGGEEREMRSAAANRALVKVYAARSAVGDSAPVKWPSDPRALHNWRPGEVIIREKRLVRAAGIDATAMRR